MHHKAIHNHKDSSIERNYIKRTVPFFIGCPLKEITSKEPSLFSAIKPSTTTILVRILAKIKKYGEICGWIAGQSMTFWKHEALCSFLQSENLRNFQTNARWRQDCFHATAWTVLFYPLLRSRFSHDRQTTKRGIKSSPRFFFMK